MTLPEGIAFGGLVLGIVSFIVKATGDEERKRSRMYQRIDEVKKDLLEKTQTREVCNIHIESINSTLLEIRQDVKALLLKNNG